MQRMGQDGQAGDDSAEVEPLELGEAEQLPDDDNNNDNVSDAEHQNTKAQLKGQQTQRQPNEQGDLNVPSDSTKTGSGAAAGSDSLLDKVGTAASKASGVIGAAGRAVIGGSANPRLDKTAEKAQRGDGTDNMTGTSLMTTKAMLTATNPNKVGPQGKKRQEAQEVAG